MDPNARAEALEPTDAQGFVAEPTNSSKDTHVALENAPILGDSAREQRLSQFLHGHLTALPAEILLKIGTYLSAKELAAFTSSNSHLYNVCRHQMYRGCWDLTMRTPGRILREWSLSDNFLKYASAFKVAIAYPPEAFESLASPQIEAHSSPFGTTDEAVTRILESACQVVSLQLCSIRFRGKVPKRCISPATTRALVHRTREVTQLNISGFWNVQLYQILEEIISSSSKVQELYIHGLDLGTLEASQSFFKHVFEGFPNLRSLSVGFYFDDPQILYAMEDAAVAAPIRSYTSLTIMPCSFANLSMALAPAFLEVKQLASVEQRLFTSLLALREADDLGNKCIFLGINAQALAELLATYNLSTVTSLSLNFPMEIHSLGFIYTTGFWGRLPDSFVYDNRITALELKTMAPEDIITMLVMQRAYGGKKAAMPFPLLRNVRATMPEWSEIKSTVKASGEWRQG